MQAKSLAAAQAQHGSAPDIERQDKANPTSLILSAAMLLGLAGREKGTSKLLGCCKAY